MRHITFFAFFAFCTLNIAFSQSITPSVMPTAGDFFLQTSASLSWTMGETATDLLSAAGSKISQGFQQPKYSNCNTVPGMPASITQTLVSNICGARVYRFTAATTTNATGYSWTLPTSVGGISGVTVDSGNILSSKVIKLKFVSNLSSVAGDSIWVRAFSACGYSANKAAKLSNLSMLPAVPASIVIAKIEQLSCGKPRYRYTAPTLALATATTTAATGYEWTFTGSLGAAASVDSPIVASPFNAQKITAYFSDTAAAVTGDSAKVRFTSACGATAWKAIKLTNTLSSLRPPLAPASVTQTLVSDACGARIYRYIAPVLPAATATANAATGYNWSLPVGALGSTGVLDSGSLTCGTCRIIRIKYSSNAGAITGDSIGYRYTSLCGVSPKKSFKLVVPVSPPAAPSAITQTLLSNVCGARVYRYSTTALPVGTSATGYNWMFKGTLFGTLGVNSFIDSGSLTSKTLLVRYLSNAASVTGDSVKVQYNSACGLGVFKAAKLVHLALVCPATAPPVFTKTNSQNFGQINDEVSVFPNPSKNNFKLTLSAKEQFTVMVYHLSGKIIKKYEKVNGQFVFGEDLPVGMYMLRIFNGQKMVVKKIGKMYSFQQ